MDGDGISELFATCLNDNNECYQLYMLQPYMIVGHDENGIVINDDLADGTASAGGYRGTLYYLPGIGKIHDSAMYAPYGTPSDTVYIMKNGRIELLSSGYFSVDSSDLPDNWSGTWYWNDEIVDENEYNQRLISDLENTTGVALCDINYFGKEEMIKALEEALE